MVLTIPRCHEHAASTNVRHVVRWERSRESGGVSFVRHLLSIGCKGCCCISALSLCHPPTTVAFSLLLSHFASDFDCALGSWSRFLRSESNDCTFVEFVQFYFFFSREGDGIVSDYFQALHFVRIYSSILIRAFIHVICTSSAYVLLYIVCFTTNIL